MVKGANTATPKGGAQCDSENQNDFVNALHKVMDLVHKHPREDQELFKSMFLRAVETDDGEERKEAVQTMAEILLDHQNAIPGAALAFQLPDPTLEERPQTRRLRAWTDFVSGRVRKLREERELTQDDLAVKAGLSQSHICRIERGMHSPSRKTLTKIANALGVPLGDIDPVD